MNKQHNLSVLGRHWLLYQQVSNSVFQFSKWAVFTSQRLSSVFQPRYRIQSWQLFWEELSHSPSRSHYSHSIAITPSLQVEGMCLFLAEDLALGHFVSCGTKSMLYVGHGGSGRGSHNMSRPLHIWVGLGERSKTCYFYTFCGHAQSVLSIYHMWRLNQVADWKQCSSHMDKTQWWQKTLFCTSGCLHCIFFGFCFWARELPFLYLTTFLTYLWKMWIDEGEDNWIFQRGACCKAEELFAHLIPRQTWRRHRHLLCWFYPACPSLALQEDRWASRTAAGWCVTPSPFHAQFPPLFPLRQPIPLKIFYFDSSCDVALNLP